MQGLNKKELEELVLDVIRIRDFTNKKWRGGRKYQNLSQNENSAVQKGT